jgi:2-isopropylmalate synthase
LINLNDKNALYIKKEEIMNDKVFQLGDIKVLGTLFRDGMQNAAMNISLGKAMEIIQWKASLGFHYAELGFAVGNDFSDSIIKAALKEDFGQLKIAVFGRTRKKGERVENSADVRAICGYDPHVAVIVCKSRLMDVANSLLTTPKENLAMIKDTLSYLKDKGYEVIVDLEHAVDAWQGRGAYGTSFSREIAQENNWYFQEVVKTSIDAGADCLVVCDTNGGASPEEINDIIESLVICYPGVELGFHGHNDCGLAVANTRAAVLSGAKHIQGVTNGYGERTGNTNLITAIARLQLKDNFPLLKKESLQQFTTYANFTAAAFNRTLPRREPFVGLSSFTTFAGMHASSQVRDSGAYSQCDPLEVGNKEMVKINRQSGRANIQAAAVDYGLPLTKDQLIRFMSEYEQEINYGAFEINDESLILALKSVRGDIVPYFRIVSREVHDSDEFISANLKVQIGGAIEKRGSNGEGPIDALSNALKKALRRHYPEIERIHLTSYDMIAVGVSNKEESAPVRVMAGFKASSGKGGPVTWATVGVHTNQNKAGLIAWINGINWFLMKNNIPNRNNH